MSLDGMLIAAAIKADRNAYESIKRTGHKLDDLPEAAAAVVRACNEYYKRDPDSTRVSTDVLRTQIIRRYGEGDAANSIMDFVASFPDDASGINIAEEHRLLRLRQVETTLAGLLATGQQRDELNELLDKRRDLLGGSEDKVPTFRLGLDDFEEDSRARIPVAPSALNSYIGGGVLRGHNLTVYGRPDSGKSAFALHNASFWINSGYKVLYVANEEPAQDITRRLFSNLGNIDIKELRDKDTLAQAFDRYEEAYENWFLYHKAGVTADNIASMAARINPDAIIVDQLKNVSVSEDNRALQLDKLARQVRELGIETGSVTMSVTQAGESGQNKLVLDLGDVEWSNTGIPGAADLMIGIGVDPVYEGEGRRMISVPKNKVSGKHGAFPVWFDPTRTKFMTKRNG